MLNSSVYRSLTSWQRQFSSTSSDWPGYNEPRWRVITARDEFLPLMSRLALVDFSVFAALFVISASAGNAFNVSRVSQPDRRFLTPARRADAELASISSDLPQLDNRG